MYSLFQKKVIPRRCRWLRIRAHIRDIRRPSSRKRARQSLETIEKIRKKKTRKETRGITIILIIKIYTHKYTNDVRTRAVVLGVRRTARTNISALRCTLYLHRLYHARTTTATSTSDLLVNLFSYQQRWQFVHVGRPENPFDSFVITIGRPAGARPGGIRYFLLFWRFLFFFVPSKQFVFNRKEKKLPDTLHICIGFQKTWKQNRNTVLRELWFDVIRHAFYESNWYVQVRSTASTEFYTILIGPK